MLADLIPKLAGQWQEEAHGYGPRPSLAGPERCERSLVYWGCGIPPESFPNRTLLVFDDSSWHEELTLDWLRKSAYRPHSEQMGVNIPAPGLGLLQRDCPTCGVKVPADHLHGHIDWVITDLLNIDRLTEHKAVSHFAFQAYWQGELPLDYITQSCLYLRGLQTVNPDLREGLLLIKNKNTAQYLEFRLAYETRTDICWLLEKVNSVGEKAEMGNVLGGITEAAIKKFRRVHQAVESRILPARQYGQDSWRCDYCRWGRKCWGDFYEQEMKALEEVPELPEDIALLARREREVAKQLKAAETSRDTLKKEITAKLLEAKIGKGLTAGLSVSLSARERQSIDKEATSKDVLDGLVYKTSRYTQLDIRERRTA